MTNRHRALIAAAAIAGTFATTGCQSSMIRAVPGGNSYTEYKQAEAELIAEDATQEVLRSGVRRGQPWVGVDLPSFWRVVTHDPGEFLLQGVAPDVILTLLYGWAIDEATSSGGGDRRPRDDRALTIRGTDSTFRSFDGSLPEGGVLLEGDRLSAEFGEPRPEPEPEPDPEI